jgi:cobalt-zinc-cadmium efflux system outer membrane protein
MRTSSQVSHVLASLFLWLPFGVHANTELSLAEAVQLATQNQPVLQSYDQASSAAQQSAIAAGQLPDPKLRLGIINLPITGGDTARFNRDDMTMSAVGVMQEMVPQSKRAAESRIREATAEQFQSEKYATVRSIRRDVALAWLDVFEAQRRTELYLKISDEMTSERKVLVSRISSSASQPSQVFQLDTLLSMTTDKRLTATRDERKARTMLARWIGNAALRPLTPILPMTLNPVNRDLAVAQIEHHPWIENSQRQEAIAQSEADRAKAERDLNWSWEVMYGKRRSDLSDMVSLQVAIDLPWDRANRQDRRAAEKMLMVEKARQLTLDRKRELDAELENVIAEAEIARAREEEHQKHLIPSAKARLHLAQAGYQAGKQNLSEVWEARRGLIEVEMQHWIILTDLQRAAVKLDYLINNDSNQGSQP